MSKLPFFLKNRPFGDNSNDKYNIQRARVILTQTEIGFFKTWPGENSLSTSSR